MLIFLFSDSPNSHQHSNHTETSIVEENVRRRSVLIAHKREADEHIVLKHVEKLRRNC